MIHAEALCDNGPYDTCDNQLELLLSGADVVEFMTSLRTLLTLRYVNML